MIEKVTLEDCEVLSLSTKYIQLQKENRAKESRNARHQPFKGEIGCEHYVNETQMGRQDLRSIRESENKTC